MVTEANRLKSERAARKRTMMLEALAAGQIVSDAVYTAGWNNTSSYYKARKEIPGYAEKCDAIMAEARLYNRKSKDVALPDPSSFSAFAEKYLPDRRPHTPTQLKIVNVLDGLQMREVVLVLIHPEAGKTATLEDYITRKLAQDPKHRFRYVSEASDLSERVVGTVKRRMTDVDEYGPFIRRYGPFYQDNQERHGKPWTNRQIVVAQNPGGERDRNLVATSWKSASYGSRIDTLVLDDVCSQNNVNQSAEIFSRIRGTFFNRGFEMRTLIVGTRVPGPGDFYIRMLDAGLITRSVILQAADIYGEPNDPSYWDREMFHRRSGPCCKGFRDCPDDGSKVTPREFMELLRHQSGEDVWFASYQQNPLADERSTFAEYIDGCLDRDRDIGELTAA